jgi:hypothetical protein
MMQPSPIHINPWREFTILMLIIMESCWITPWFKSLTPETYAIQSLRVLIILSCIVLFSHLLVRLMEYLKLKKSIRRELMVAYLVIVCFTTIKMMLYAQESVSLMELFSRPIRGFADLRSIIPPEFIIIVTVLIGFWRGLSLAQEHIGPSAVQSHFLLGIIMFVVFVFFTTLITGENPGDFFFLFLFTSLIAMCTARMTVVGMVRGGKQNIFNRSWFIGILFAALLVVGIASIFGDLIAQQFTWIGAVFFGLFGSILILIWVITNPVLSLLIKVFSDLIQDSSAIERLGDSFQKINEMIMGLGQRMMSFWDKSGISTLFSKWAPTIKTIILIGIIVVIVSFVFLWMGLRLWKDRERRLEQDEKRENLHSENLFQSLLSILRGGLMRAAKSMTQLTDFNQRRRLRAAARIRQVYADLLELCAKMGQPRPDALTPLEFVPKLDQLFPEFNPEVDTITQAYVRVRYGLLPETQDEITDVDAAWKKLHAAGNELLSERKHAQK